MVGQKRATKYIVEYASLQTRHKDARGKRFVEDAPLFIAPQQCSLEMYGFRRATKTLVENR
jgi:hypothetical protein